jgi:hypothetical protein
VRGGDDLELCRRHLGLEAPVALEQGDHLACARDEVERLRVDEHQLLLEPDRRGGASLLERGSQHVGGRQRVAHGPGG